MTARSSPPEVDQASSHSSVCAVEQLPEPRLLTVSIELDGDCPEGEWIVRVLLLRRTLLENSWTHPTTLSAEWDCDASCSNVMAGLADEPLVVLLRPPQTGRSPKEQDPYVIEKAAAGTMDLLPLFLGEDIICAKVNLVYLETGENAGCSVRVKVEANQCCPPLIAMRVTLLRAACLPVGKTENMYMGAIALSKLDLPIANLSFSSSSLEVQEKSMWASLVQLRTAGLSHYHRPTDDVYVDPELKGNDNNNCNPTEWNLCRRILVDYDLLRERFSFPFIVEIAGLPRVGKPELRGQYMAFVDVKVLLEPGECGMTIRAPLRQYDATLLPEETPPMLDLPTPNLYTAVSQAIPSELETITDENGHQAYVDIRFEVSEPMEPITAMAEFFEILEIDITDVPNTATNEWIPAPLPPKPSLDAQLLKSECGALTLQTELAGAILGRRISRQKRKPAAVAQSLLNRTKELLIEHHPGKCSTLELYDVISGQHAAARRAVTASMAPKPPPPRAPATHAAARARFIGETRLAESAITKSLSAHPTHPRPLISLALRRLEANDRHGALEALQMTFEKQPNNRYILWTLGALENARREKGELRAEAALRIAVENDDTLNGTRRVIGWAALHAHYHSRGQMQAAFVAARNMRKACELAPDWEGLLEHWRNTSGEEEHLWDPFCISHKNPLVMAAAMFLCLRVYDFVERLLLCSDKGCGEIGSHIPRDEKTAGAEVRYVRASSSLLRGRIKSAIHHVDKSINTYGPACRMARLRVSCLLSSKDEWDDECEAALEEAERCGAPSDSAQLLRAAAAEKRDPLIGLQRAARAHRAAPSAQSALAIARLKSRLGRERSAERWAAAAVGHEPDSADAWAELARQLLTRRKTKAARACLRTARQVGPISSYLLNEINILNTEISHAGLPELLTEELCLCHL